MTSDRPANLFLIPSPVRQELAPDGINLTPVAGLHYVIHLFHRVNLKTAEDAEFDDWIRNRNDEDWFTITGLQRLSSQLDNSGWQVEAKRQVRGVLRQVLELNKVNLTYDILVVVNPIRWRTTGPTVYNVRLSSVEASKRIRELFSGFFRRANPVKIPGNLKGVKLHNKITLNTKIRVAIMRQLGEHYVESNPGGFYKVRRYEPRPLLVLNPPPGSATARIRTLIFTDAVSTLPTHFTDEDLTQIFMSVGSSNRDRLRALFVVLSDDDHDRCLELVKKYHQDRRQDARGKDGRGQDGRQGQFQDGGRSGGHRGGHGHSGNRSASAITQTGSHSSFVSGAGAGMEVEGNQAFALSLLRQPPPPPPPTPPPTPKVSFGPSRNDGSRRGRTGKTSRTAPLKRDHSLSSSPRSRRSKPSKKRSRRSQIPQAGQAHG